MQQFTKSALYIQRDGLVYNQHAAIYKANVKSTAACLVRVLVDAKTYLVRVLVDTGAYLVRVLVNAGTYLVRVLVDAGEDAEAGGAADGDERQEASLAANVLADAIIPEDAAHKHRRTACNRRL